jgi:hypothetical protein
MSWLYDPKNEYKGQIFMDPGEYAEKLADGWECAPYPTTKQTEKAKIIDYFDAKVEKIVENPSPVAVQRRKPGRKKQG